MRVAIVIDSLAGGGAEKVMLTLAEEMSKQSHHVTILSLSNRIEHELPSNIHVESLFNHKATKVDRLWRVKKSVEKLEAWFKQQSAMFGEFNLVLSNLDRSNNLLAQSAIENVHYVIHSSIDAELSHQKKWNLFARFYLKKSKRRLSGKSLVCVSKGIEDEIFHGDVSNNNTLRTIYNPINFSEIQKKAEIEIKDIPEEPYIIHVGRFARVKRHDVLFSAFSRVPRPYKLVLLCNKTKKARLVAERFGIADRLVLPGFQKNPYNWIKHAKALVLSSDYEGLPTVLIEALALRVPVVSTDCTHGPKEILTGDLAQFLVPIRDSDALGKAINVVLEDKPEISNPDILNKVSSNYVASQYLMLGNK